MEFVWVLKREDLFRNRYPHGLEVLGDDALGEVVVRMVTLGFFVERAHAERDLSLKQVIPYCIVASGGRVLRTRRLPKGGESRLHGKRSIGIGGHLNPEDRTPEERTPDERTVDGDVLSRGLRRELEEELEFTAPWSAQPVGLLNDDSTEVGAVHVGLVHVVETAVEPRIRETDVLEGEWVTVEELARSVREERGSYESWSAFVIERMAAGADGVPYLVPPGGMGTVFGSSVFAAVPAAAASSEKPNCRTPSLTAPAPSRTP